MAVSTMDGRPSGVLRGVLTGYAVFEVVVGGETGSAEEGDTTDTDTFVVKANARALDEESVECKKYHAFYEFNAKIGRSVRHVLSALLVKDGVATKPQVNKIKSC